MTDTAGPDHDPSTAVEPPPPAPASLPGEPEKLTIPPEMVADLLVCAIRSQEGNGVWRGFTAAHGFPSWLVQGRWRLAVGPAEVVRQSVADEPSPNGRA
jgi:hypothetical protein